VSDVVKRAREASAGFAGRFEFQPEHTIDRGVGHVADFCDLDDRLVYIAPDCEDEDEDACVIADRIEGHVAEPIATMLNAVPALVARIEKLEALLLGTVGFMHGLSDHADCDDMIAAGLLTEAAAIRKELNDE
jgi:hypothetical protein